MSPRALLSRNALAPLLCALLAACGPAEVTETPNETNSSNTTGQTTTNGQTGGDPDACTIVCAEAANAVTVCRRDQCARECAPGWADLDGDLQAPASNGCEASCVPSNGGVEVCDGLDNDCDGKADNAPGAGETCMVGVGACARTGMKTCAGAPGDEVICDVTPGEAALERCDGLDNDCDGEVDEDFPSLGDACTSGQGLCEVSGALVCNAEGDGVTCDAQEDLSQKQAERCGDALDGDCDGDPDNGFESVGTACPVGVGACATQGAYACVDGAAACVGTPLTPPEADERTCDGIDNDCDGQVDEGCNDDGDDWCDARMTTNGALTICVKGGGDCDDTNPLIYPGSPHSACDGKDNDCDGTIDELGPLLDASGAYTPLPANPADGVLPTGGTDQLDSVSQIKAAQLPDGRYCAMAIDDTGLLFLILDAEGRPQQSRRINLSSHFLGDGANLAAVQHTHDISCVALVHASQRRMKNTSIPDYKNNTHDLRLYRFGAHPAGGSIPVTDWTRVDTEAFLNEPAYTDYVNGGGVGATLNHPMRSAVVYDSVAEQHRVYYTKYFANQNLHQVAYAIYPKLFTTNASPASSGTLLNSTTYAANTRNVSAIVGASFASAPTLVLAALANNDGSDHRFEVGAAVGGTLTFQSELDFRESSESAFSNTYQEERFGGHFQVVDGQVFFIERMRYCTTAFGCASPKPSGYRITTIEQSAQGQLVYGNVAFVGGLGAREVNGHPTLAKGPHGKLVLMDPTLQRLIDLSDRTFGLPSGPVVTGPITSSGHTLRKPGQLADTWPGALLTLGTHSGELRALSMGYTNNDYVFQVERMSCY